LPIYHAMWFWTETVEFKNNPLLIRPWLLRAAINQYAGSTQRYKYANVTTISTYGRPVNHPQKETVSVHPG
jgi:hypothetical protein